MTRPDRASEADQLPEWHVEVDGCVNFRDAGGWETIEGAMAVAGVCIARTIRPGSRPRGVRPSIASAWRK